jgi:hypothetical protein
MTYSRPITVIAAALALAACGPTNTVPAPVAPSDPIQYYDLNLPESLQVQSIEFAATTFSEVSGYGGTTGSEVGGRAFIQVYAIHRETGEHYLLLYEDIANRKQPVHVIRLQPTPDTTILRPPSAGPGA